MKINLDLSNTELNNFVQKIKDDAHMIAELTNQVSQARNDFWKAQETARLAEAAKAAAVRDAEFWKSEYEYQRGSIERMQNTIDELQTSLDAYK